MALVERPAVDVLTAPTPTVTADQLELVKKTVAQGATADELKLYLYDCARQGVHPLDKLIHFTKRSGKYTPITSIDFMRIRAADTNEYAGSDDAVFVGTPMKDDFAATVSVRRFVQGTPCLFTATARWTEYKPDANDFMWKKMPHTMLGKCAEALALRKGFPRQLAGLYANEEMDQAGPRTGGPSLVISEADDRPDPPAGFETWWAQLTTASDNGVAALELAWGAKGEPFKRYRQYVDTYHKADMATLKAAAKQVPA